MIPEYINNWLTIIEGMNTDNTYKLAWGRAIIECVSLNQYSEQPDKIIVSFHDISQCMLKYYWNQLFFFNLKQAPYKDKVPVICRLTEQLIECYKRNANSTIPIWYSEEVIEKVTGNEFKKTLSKIERTLHENVSWRYLRVQDQILPIYEYQEKVPHITIEKEHVQEIIEYSIILSRLLNYKWTQLLEKFNYQPKITNKVSSISDTKIRRNNLTKFKEELLKANGGVAIDFYSGQVLDEKDVSVDHVLPWSFMYSDDIWNLVITSKSHNSIKSNTIPNEETIKKLEERNLEIAKTVSDSYQKDMKEAIDNNLLRKFYLACRL